MGADNTCAVHNARGLSFRLEDTKWPLKQNSLIWSAAVMLSNIQYCHAHCVHTQKDQMLSAQSAGCCEVKAHCQTPVNTPATHTHYHNHSLIVIISRNAAVVTAVIPTAPAAASSTTSTTRGVMAKVCGPNHLPHGLQPQQPLPTALSLLSRQPTRQAGDNPKAQRQAHRNTRVNRHRCKQAPPAAGHTIHPLCCVDVEHSVKQRGAPGHGHTKPESLKHSPQLQQQPCECQHGALGLPGSG